MSARANGPLGRPRQIVQRYVSGSIVAVLREHQGKVSSEPTGTSRQMSVRAQSPSVVQPAIRQSPLQRPW